VIDLSEEDILSGLRNGDEECLMEMIDLYKKKIIALCFSYTKDYQEAEDLSQETFISIYKNINSFRGDCSFSTYIYRITVSRCLDYKRKRSIKGFLTGLITMHGQNDIDIDEKNFIQQCIKSLKEELKQPIILYYYIGLDQKEIAEVLSISPKAVEGRIYRAKQKLKEKIEEGGYGLWSREGII
jgi:RNA polymerase sigma factor (sigma-70 family)